MSTQRRQQDEHPLVRSPAGAEAEVPGERTLQYSHLVARFKLVTLRKLDQTVALALTQVIDDLISDARRPDTVLDQADDTDAPAGGVPLRLDGKETITRKERAAGFRSCVRVRSDARAATENRSRTPLGRDSGARAARAAAPGLRPPSTTLGNPPKPIARSAEPRLSCGAWFGLGFVGFPVGNTTGDFLLALGLVRHGAASSAASSCSLSCPANRCRPPSDIPRQ